jgi:DNA-binding LacI/PurR family transcriptional regulator
VVLSVRTSYSKNFWETRYAFSSDRLPDAATGGKRAAIVVIGGPAALLALPEPPDAVFCFNDLMALGAMSVLHEAGLRIPQDVAIVGIDDTEDGRYATPALITIAPDKEAIGRLAVSLLIERIKKIHTLPPAAISVLFRLCVRGSTVENSLWAA